jgi:hypothetical protein
LLSLHATASFKIQGLTYDFETGKEVQGIDIEHPKIYWPACGAFLCKTYLQFYGGKILIKQLVL